MTVLSQTFHRQHLIVSGFLLLITLIGIAGLLYPPTQAFFQATTPFYLMLHVIVLVSFHRHFNRSFWVFAIFTFTVGYLVEVWGVQTGVPFGAYEYQKHLGPQFFGVPLMIGVNWFMLIYCCGMISEYLPVSKPIKAAGGSLLMVAMDVVIEPVAIELELWLWEASHVPLQNYAAWFLISYVMLIVFQYASFQKTNPLASVVFIVLLAFFLLLIVL